jgi:hypothetical protein
MSLRTVTPSGGAAFISVYWDASMISVPAGTVLDIAPGSPLESAYGAGNLTDLSGQALVSDQTGSGPAATSNA